MILELPDGLKAQDPDLIPLINDRLRAIREQLEAPEEVTAVAKLAGAPVYSGTHAQRLALSASSVPEGSIFVETDRTNVAYVAATVASIRAWRYKSGVHRCTLAAKPTGLTTYDSGFLMETTDRNHLHRWTGTAWVWGPGEAGSAYIQAYAVAPGTGWRAVDGATNILYEKDDCTTATLDLPDMTTDAFVRGSTAYTALLDPAVAPTLSASTGAASATTVVQSGAGATVASSTHTHALNTGTVSDTGRPKSVAVLWYFRQ